MSVTLHGLKPASDQGKVFTRSARSWHSLWIYCDTTHDDLAELVSYAYNGYGAGLDGDRALLLAGRLRTDIAAGVAHEYVGVRDAILSALPDKPCGFCNGTGVRVDEVGIALGMPDHELDADIAVELGRDKGWCNGCYGDGTRAAWELGGKLTVDDIDEFASFLTYCGGFDFVEDQ